MRVAGEGVEDEGQADQQALSILDIAEEASKMARKEWEAVSKLDAEAARCVQCEEWWRKSVKDVVRACIVCSIAISTAKKGIHNAKGLPLGSFLKSEMAETGKGYHEFWVVPKLSIQ